MEQVFANLKQYWGYDSFRPLQQEAVSASLTNRDSLVVMPTGGGKSLCYQLPALSMPGTAVVVSPLIALMKDQVDSLCGAGIPAAAINSSMDLQARRDVANKMRSGELKLLYLAPERLLNDRTLDFLASQQISFFAIDEAHCISSWGHDFRPEYRGLRKLKEFFPNTAVHAFTATAAPQVREDIISQLGLSSPEILIGNFQRANLFYYVERRQNWLSQIRKVLDRFRNQSGIIYCISRAEVEKTSNALNEAGYKTLPYHAGLPDEVRRANQEAFITEQVDTIVATVAFGMGIDKSNVRYVIHAEMPKSVENYQQESGRAGRDGLNSECWLFYSPNDVMTWQFVLENGPPEFRESSMKSVQQMYDFCTSVECRHRFLVAFFGQDLEKPCGSCDICLGHYVPALDSKTIAQKIVSCVVRVNEQFGAEHIAKVLTGSRESRIVQFRHDKLSTWGILKEASRLNVRGWIEQLISQRYLERHGEFQQIQTTILGRELLRGHGEPRLLQPANAVEPESEKKRNDDWAGVDRSLFDQLRILRRKLADDSGVPAYVVFNDNTLREMAKRKPIDIVTFLQVPGVGQKKAADYGEIFLASIEEYRTKAVGAK